jgi:tRNA pseudouridine55 synthase/H/ACA ribonucleoprotein complex subunit 4
MKMLNPRLDNSFIFIDKPPGMLSHEVTSIAGRVLGAKKAGHIGTLDPDVTGVLVVALGKATGLIRFFSGMRKEYVCIIDWKKEVAESFAIEKFKEHSGEITQIPPEMSAVARRPRKRTVHGIELLEHNGRFSVFRCVVDAGTYIRTLCEAMGGEMKDLRRVASGPITEKGIFTMQQITDAAALASSGKPKELERMLVSPEKMIDVFGVKKAWAKKGAALNVANGAGLAFPGIDKSEKFGKGETIAIFCKEILVGVGEADADSGGKSGIAVRPLRVTASKAEIESA